MAKKGNGKNKWEVGVGRRVNGGLEGEREKEDENMVAMAKKVGRSGKDQNRTGSLLMFLSGFSYMRSLGFGSRQWLRGWPEMAVAAAGRC